MGKTKEEIIKEKNKVIKSGKIVTK
jgi:hypothetical protein